MKLSLITFLLISLSYALPLKKEEKFRLHHDGEYIVISHEKIKDAKHLGANYYLVKGKKRAKGLKSFPNYTYYGDYMESAPNDPLFKDQFHHVMIHTTKAWEKSMGDHEVIVAVTDNEFLIDHDDLKGQWWTNKEEIPGNGIDDDGNGYVDDVHGWDFIGEDNDVTAPDEPTHGTHVAGIIAAKDNNNLGGSGIAPKVKIMPLRWYGKERRWTSAIVLETYLYAVNNGAKIINTSYNVDGLIDDQAYLEAIKYAKDNDVLIFNSAGNDRRKNPPRQQLEDLILVCSVGSRNASNADKKSSFSNYGTGIDLCAPGDPILAPVNGWDHQGNARYGNLQGTSMAAPVAAAVAALIWSHNPNFSALEVREKLLESTDNIDRQNRIWHRGLLGSGRVNALKALE